MSKLTATPLTPAIGAELHGIDFSKPVSEGDCNAIYDALLTYQVVFFRDQQLEPEAHLAFANDFGNPEHRHPVYPHAEGYPEVMLLDIGPDNPPDNDQWHSDVSFKAEPPFASILHSRVIPPLGGDTLWSSMTAAYEALPAEMKAHIGGLRAVHDMSDFRNLYTIGEPDGSAMKLNAAHQTFGSAIHPMVKVHPMTGKPALYANPGYTVQVEGLTSAQSRRLLTYLFDHMNQPEFQVRFRWTENCIAMWDNRCTMHYAIADYLPHRRLMHRVTVTNDRRADAKAANQPKRRT